MALVILCETMCNFLGVPAILPNKTPVSVGDAYRQRVFLFVKSQPPDRKDQIAGGRKVKK